MDPVTIFVALVILTGGLERALREPAQLKRQHKLGLKQGTLLDTTILLTPEDVLLLSRRGAKGTVIKMIRNGSYVKEGSC